MSTRNPETPKTSAVEELERSAETALQADNNSFAALEQTVAELTEEMSQEEDLEKKAEIALKIAGIKAEIARAKAAEAGLESAQESGSTATPENSAAETGEDERGSNEGDAGEDEDEDGKPAEVEEGNEEEGQESAINTLINGVENGIAALQKTSPKWAVVATGAFWPIKKILQGGGFMVEMISSFVVEGVKEKIDSTLSNKDAGWGKKAIAKWVTSIFSNPNTPAVTTAVPPPPPAPGEKENQSESSTKPKIEGSQIIPGTSSHGDTAPPKEDDTALTLLPVREKESDRSIFDIAKRIGVPMVHAQAYIYIMRSETGKQLDFFDNGRFIRTKVTRSLNKGRVSTAYGPSQITVTLAKSYKKKYPNLFTPKEIGFLEKFISQGQIMLSREKGIYGYGGAGEAYFRTTEGKILYYQVALKMWSHHIKTQNGDLIAAARKWRGDPEESHKKYLAELQAFAKKNYS